MKFTYGCDPEIFVTNKEGRPRSAYGLVPGTKEKPHKVKDGAYQVDGMALELNIDPVDNEEDWVNRINSVMIQLKDAIPDYNFLIEPSVRFNGNHMKAQPEEAKELGCDPDFNAYTLEANERPNGKTTLRTGAGHIHLGFCEDADVKDPEHIQRCATLVKHLDAYVGITSLLWDNDYQRRALYGKAGAFRPKPHGVEYRVLSNAWLKDEKTMRVVFKLTEFAVKELLAGNRPWEGKEDFVQYAINHSQLQTMVAREVDWPFKVREALGLPEQQWDIDHFVPKKDR